MSDLNQVSITGRLGADAEIRRTQDGRPIANMRLAVSETWRDRNSGERKEATEWINVVCFNEGLCKIIEQYLKKGSRLFIQGSWKTRKWQDQQGNDRYSTELVMQGFDAKLIMLDGQRSEDRQDDRPARQQERPQQQPTKPYTDQQGSFDSDLDDDIPF